MRKWITLGSGVIAVLLFFTLVDFSGESQSSPSYSLPNESFIDRESSPVQNDSSTGIIEEVIDPTEDPEGRIAAVPRTGSAMQEIEIARLLDEFSANTEFDLEVLESVDTETAYKLINIASGLADRFRYEAGIPWADDAIRLDPGLPEAHLISGYLHFKVLNTEKAIAAFEKTIELDPLNFDAHMYLGRIYNGNDNPTLGMAYLTRAIEITNSPTDLSLGFAYRAISHALIDQYNDALDDLETALGFDPDNGWAAFFQGVILEEMELRELDALEMEGIPGQNVGVAP